MNKYLSFLLEKRYLEQLPDGSSHDKLRLTDRGARFLRLLAELEGEINTFRNEGPKNVANTDGGRIPDRPHPVGEAMKGIDLEDFLGSDLEFQIPLSLIRAYSLQGQMPSERAEIERMLSLASALSDNSMLAEAHGLKSVHLTRIGLYREAMIEGREALDIARLANDRSRIAGAQLAIGEACTFLGEKDEPLRHFSRALTYFEEKKDLVGQANATRLIAQFFLKHDDLASALGRANRALELFRQIGDRVGEDEALRFIGDICCARGEYLLGLEYYERVLKIRRESGNRSREGGALGDIGDVYLSLGEYEKSLDLHVQALAIDTGVGYRFGQVWDIHDLGVVHFNLGNPAQACEELRMAIRQAKEIKVPDLIALCDNDLSAVLRKVGGEMNLKDALQTASEASKIGEIYSLLSNQIMGESNMAMALLLLGRRKEALDHSRKAVRLLEGSGPTDVQTEEIFFNYYLILRKNQELDEARCYLKRAYDRMMSNAGNISDSATKETFLGRVTINREITSAWQEHNGLGLSFPTLRHPLDLS